MLTVVTPRPGDIFLEHDNGWIDRVIQFGERLRRGESQSHWNHAGVVSGVNVLGQTTVIEATGTGVVMDTLDAVGRGETRVVPVEPESARVKVVEFARGHLGRHYGYDEIACIVLTLLTGTRLRFGLQGQYICSGLTACSLTFAGIVVGDGDNPEWAMPADLAVDSFTSH